VSEEEFSDKRENEKLADVSRRVYIDAVVEVFICASGQFYSRV